MVMEGLGKSVNEGLGRRCEGRMTKKGQRMGFKEKLREGLGGKGDRMVSKRR